LEFYLYQEVDYWIDPWWFVGSTNALAYSIPLDPNTLGLVTTGDTTWYIAGYWRDSWFGWFTFQEFESGRFTLNDGPSNLCALEFAGLGADLTCCGEGQANDLCRSNVGPLQFELEDMSLAVGILDEETPCSIGIDFSVVATARYLYVDEAGQDSPIEIYEQEYPYEYSNTFDLAAETLEFPIQVVDLSNFLVPPPANAVINADLFGVFEMTCDNVDGITLTFIARVVGEVEIPDVKTWELDQVETEVYHYTFSWDELLSLLPTTTSPTTTSSDDYCVARPTSALDSNLGRVHLDGFSSSIDNTVDCPGQTSTQLYLDEEADLVVGQSYSLVYDVTTCGSEYSRASQAWIDWQGTGEFTESDALGATQQSVTSETISLIFTVPLDATVGSTRLRVCFFMSDV
jgi:hypothetical protein